MKRQPTIDFTHFRRNLESVRIRGRFELKNVKFAYPTRPSVPVLKGVNLTIEEGKTTAIVGHTGCGKSTIIGLLSRLYDPT